MSIFCPFDCTSAAEIPSCTYVMIPYDFLVDVGVLLFRCPLSKASSVIQCDLQLEEMQICGLSGKLSSLVSADTFAS